MRNRSLSSPSAFIIPCAPGGGADSTTPIVQANAMELLGISLIVDNRAGGGTPIATHVTQTAPTDGYTVGK